MLRTGKRVYFSELKRYKHGPSRMDPVDAKRSRSRVEGRADHIEVYPKTVEVQGRDEKCRRS